jgi:hypothetical protein
MSDHAADLMSALERRDAPAFAATTRRVQVSGAELKRTVDSLLSSVTCSDARRAKLAVDALRFSGLALEGHARQAMIGAIERMYSPQLLTRMATYELTRERKNHAKQSVQLELLKSVVMAMLRDGGARQAGFARLVETIFEGTRLGAKIRKWRTDTT